MNRFVLTIILRLGRYAVLPVVALACARADADASLLNEPDASARRHRGTLLQLRCARLPKLMSMRRKTALLMLAAALPMLSACGQQVPDDKAAYVGAWHAQGMDLELTREGTVHYKRVWRNTGLGTTTTKINAPLQRFEGDNFVVGILFLTTTFEVSTPPHQEAGTWKMVVDGVELNRAR